MIVYIDTDYKCHVQNDGTMREVNSPLFDGLCAAMVEGSRYVPFGETWVREDGEEFHGEMVSVWKPIAELEQEQREYEHEQLVSMRSENDDLLADIAALVEELYESDIERIEE